MMFSAYFNQLQKQLLKTYTKSSKKEAVSAPVPAKAKKPAKKDYKPVMDAVSSMFSPEICVMSKKIADQSGYISDSADFIAVRKKFSAIDEIFHEAVPAELTAASFNVIEEVNHKQLTDVLIKAALIKKIDHYSEEAEDPAFIPGFIIALHTTYSLSELKEAIIDIYDKDSVEPMFEFDIMMVLGKGLIIKNWREGARSFIALETGEDTMKWFFLLLNEYVESKTAKDLDLRSYVKEAVHYNEY